ncbi:hypothetical protein Sked_37990 [Sanguibacter keddieii DSM 10542]|uniref:Uncharacterized protein n=1 Tax=Sanguibacter keddieii (strain ATCC 51767 / DSM 10542 / NCFB 3025 / ST-74) TaxID=446469 RepID=D1BGG5_SANKS|nr:hypothetical protein Sked_37990 [Sanguibacter keddieii DSM 10542]
MSSSRAHGCAQRLGGHQEIERSTATRFQQHPLDGTREREDDHRSQFSTPGFHDGEVHL